MATFFFGVQGPTLSFQQNLAIADADAPRIMAYLMSSSYGTVTENVQTTAPDASWSPGEGQTEADRPMISVQEWVTRAATPEEAAANYANAVLASLLGATLAAEKAAAAAAAADAVQPIIVE